MLQEPNDFWIRVDDGHNEWITPSILGIADGYLDSNIIYCWVCYLKNYKKPADNKKIYKLRDNKCPNCGKSPRFHIQTFAKLRQI